MIDRIRSATPFVIFSILLSVPAVTLAHGGGTGGGHGGGGARFGGGGGHFAGGGHYGGHYGGYGRGYYGRGYGYGRGWGGYPYYGYGLGFGLGLGVGYGLGYGYGGYGGYSGYGYPAYGYGYGYDPYYYGTGAAPYYPAGAPANAAPYAGAVAPPSATTSAPASIAQPEAAIGMAKSTREFAEKGEAAFKSGDYQGAVYAWRHAAVDDPQNGLITMMLGQALFAIGKYDEAAGAIQAAMHRLPKEQWGVVVGHHTELYGKSSDYTAQLRALERAMKSKSEDPALRFLTAFQYAYLGFTDRAIEQLDHAIRLAPRDELSKQLRDTLRAKTKPAPIPPLPGVSSGPALRPTPQEEPEQDADEQ